MMAAREAKESSELAEAPSVQDAAANLAKSTGGTVVQTQQEDWSDGHPGLSMADAASVDPPKAG